MQQPPYSSQQVNFNYSSQSNEPPGKHLWQLNHISVHVFNQSKESYWRIAFLIIKKNRLKFNKNLQFKTKKKYNRFFKLANAPNSPGSATTTTATIPTANANSSSQRAHINGGRFDFEDGGTYCGGWDEGKRITTTAKKKPASSYGRHQTEHCSYAHNHQCTYLYKFPLGLISFFVSLSLSPRSLSTICRQSTWTWRVHGTKASRRLFRCMELWLWSVWRLHLAKVDLWIHFTFHVFIYLFFSTSFYVTDY